MTQQQAREQQQILEALEALRFITGAAYSPGTARKQEDWAQRIQDNHQVVAALLYKQLTEIADSELEGVTA